MKNLLFSSIPGLLLTLMAYAMEPKPLNLAHFAHLAILANVLWLGPILSFTLYQRSRWNHGTCGACGTGWRYYDSFYETDEYRCSHGHQVNINWYGLSNREKLAASARTRLQIE